MSDQPSPRLKIAVIGTGAAGLTAAHLLQRKHDVLLFEKNDRLGGHTNTVTIPSGPDEGTPVDTGFIVLNNKNYPILTRLLAQLGCPTRWSNMSFGYYSELTGLTYAGTGFDGMFADRLNLLRPSYYAFIRAILRFCRRARADLKAGTLGDLTLGDYLKREKVSDAAIRHYIIPMGAAIWSAPHRDMLAFPAATLLRFWENHGLLSTEDRPRWQTVVGGSCSYVRAIQSTFRGAIHLGARITHVVREDTGAVIHAQDGRTHRVDKVVFAAHADESLKLLADPSREEKELLGAWSYQPNHTVLHTDVSFLPPNRKSWASWNYVEPREVNHARAVPVTYWMNLLQGLTTREQYCVTLNPHRPIPHARIVREIEYTHPVFNSAAIATQARLPSLNGVRHTYFCGSYFGYGFHEDAVRSGLDVAKLFGIDLDQ